jgi:hypothetical protein
VTETTVELPEGRITDEMLEQMRAFTGVKLRISHAISNEEATRVAIAKFAAGIGDGNPLWTDEEYARKPFATQPATGWNPYMLSITTRKPPRPKGCLTNTMWDFRDTPGRYICSRTSPGTRVG